MRFLMIALAYSVPTGVVAGWAGVLDMILTPVQVSQVRRIPCLAHLDDTLSIIIRFPGKEELQI